MLSTLFPMFMDLNNKKCLILGGGDVAYRKTQQLLKTGADLYVHSPKLNASMQQLYSQKKLKWYQTVVGTNELRETYLVIAASSDQVANKQLATICEKLRIPCNVVDDPKNCSFYVPAVTTRGNLQVAISTRGSAPVLARKIRSHMDHALHPKMGDLASFAEGYRKHIKRAFPNIEMRRNFWESFFDSPIALKVLEGKEKEARKLMLQEINTSQIKATQKEGKVYLVGAGPGNPDLLTVKAARLLGQAEVVVYDALVSKEILDFTRRDAEFLYMGKKLGCKKNSQASINQMLIQLANQGKTVVRLKGGDPFIFGRGGEEILALKEKGIAFEIVPGITAASGASTACNVPLTYRNVSRTVTYISGHYDTDFQPDWQSLAKENQTIVVYMGLAKLESICTNLIENGCPLDRPALLIEKATTEEQRQVQGTIQNLPKMVEKYNLQSPLIVIIGEVVQLANREIKQASKFAFNSAKSISENSLLDLSQMTMMGKKIKVHME